MTLKFEEPAYCSTSSSQFGRYSVVTREPAELFEIPKNSFNRILMRWNLEKHSRRGRMLRFLQATGNDACNAVYEHQMPAATKPTPKADAKALQTFARTKWQHRAYAARGRGDDDAERDARARLSLRAACETGDVVAALAAFAAAADPAAFISDAYDDGQTPLHVAAANGRFLVAKFLTLNGDVAELEEFAQERDALVCASDSDRKPCHFFNSFFFTKLLENGSYNYRQVKRWTKRFDLFSRSKVFAPVNVGNMHWCMVMVDVARREVRYFDSMGAGGEPYLKAMKRYLEDEHRAKKGSELEGGWTLTRTTRDTPRQTNGYDCGVFASFCAHYMSLTEQLDFSQNDIQHFRIRMMVDILNKRIHTGGDV